MNEKTAAISECKQQIHQYRFPLTYNGNAVKVKPRKGNKA